MTKETQTVAETQADGDCVWRGKPPQSGDDADSQWLGINSSGAAELLVAMDLSTSNDTPTWIEKEMERNMEEKTALSMGILIS